MSHGLQELFNKAVAPVIQTAEQWEIEDRHIRKLQFPDTESFTLRPKRPLGEQQHQLNGKVLEQQQQQHSRHQSDSQSKQPVETAKFKRNDKRADSTNTTATNTANTTAATTLIETEGLSDALNRELRMERRQKRELEHDKENDSRRIKNDNNNNNNKNDCKKKRIRRETRAQIDSINEEHDTLERELEEKSQLEYLKPANMHKQLAAFVASQQQKGKTGPLTVVTSLTPNNSFEGDLDINHNINNVEFASGALVIDTHSAPSNKPLHARSLLLKTMNVLNNNN